jgi:hypothetical protein
MRVAYKWVYDGKRHPYKWVQDGKLTKYVGKYAIAIGAPVQGIQGVYLYSVWANKRGGVIYYTDNGFKYKHENNYTGIFTDRRKATSLVNNIDKGLSSRGISIIRIDMPKEAQSTTERWEKDKYLILLDTKHPEDIHHEMAHIKSGHMDDFSRSKDKMEVEATRVEISALRKLGMYDTKHKREIATRPWIRRISKGDKKRKLAIMRGLSEQGVKMLG